VIPASGGFLDGLIDAAKVVKRDVQRYRLHVRQYLAVSVRQSCEPAKVHPDAEIRSLNV
jgi:hypothetical protein